MAKNELQKHKKHDSIKWFVVFVLLAVLVVGMVGTVLQVFTDHKPSDMFHKWTNAHDFVDGVCTVCGKAVADTLTFESEVAADGTDVTVNYYTEDYKLIESKTIKAGEAIPVLKDGCKQSFIAKNTIVASDNMPNYSVYAGDKWIELGEEFFATSPQDGKPVNLMLVTGVFCVEKNVSLLGLNFLTGFSFSVNGEERVCEDISNAAGGSGEHFNDGVFDVTSNTTWLLPEVGDVLVMNWVNSGFVNAVQYGLILYDYVSAAEFAYKSTDVYACYDIQNIIVHGTEG